MLQPTYASEGSQLVLIQHQNSDDDRQKSHLHSQHSNTQCIASNIPSYMHFNAIKHCHAQMIIHLFDKTSMPDQGLLAPSFNKILLLLFASRSY